MKRNATTALLALAFLVTPFAYGQEGGFQDPEVSKSAQTGFKFLSLSVDARASALGGALTAGDQAGSVSMFYNPAGMASMEGVTDVAVMRTQFIADINYNAGSIAFRPADGVYGVFGLSVVAVDYGDFEGTVRDVTESGYYEWGSFSPTALAVGVGYARALSDRFAIGGNVKYAHQDLGAFPVTGSVNAGLETDSYKQGTVAFDFGVLYKTGFRSLNLAMSVRNFSRELKYEQENFELPLTFRIGVEMDVMDLASGSLNPNVHSLRVAVDAVRPRDFAEQLTIGGEYLFMNTLALRAGYAFPTDTEQFNLGVGLQQRLAGFGFAFNYAYTSYDIFDAVHRLGIQLSL
jgi:hypothetical protein